MKIEKAFAILNFQFSILHLDPGQRLVQVGDDVVDRLDTDREAHIVVGDAGELLLLGRELAVGGAGRVDRQALRVAGAWQPPRITILLRLHVRQ